MIDSHSEILVEAHRDLDVPVTTAWKVLADIEGWPTWVPSVRHATLDGAVLAGSGFRADGGVGLRCVLREVERPRRLAWTADSPWSTRAVVWDLEPQGDRSCRVRCRQAAGGLGPRAARWLGRRPAERERARVDAWVEALRKRCRTEVPCD